MALTMIGINPQQAQGAVVLSACEHHNTRCAVLQTLHAHTHIDEALLIQNTHRLELYAISQPGIDVFEALLQAFEKPPISSPNVSSYSYFAEGLNAITHLLSTIAGLDEFSNAGGPVCAEHLLQSINESIEVEVLGSSLQRIADEALAFAQTCDGNNAASQTAQITTALELIQRVFDHLDRRTVLMIGSHPWMDLLEDALCAQGLTHVMLLSDAAVETDTKHRRVSANTVGSASALLGSADIVLAAQPLPHFAFDKRLAQKTMRMRRGQPSLIFDCSANEDAVDARVASIDGVFRYTLSDIEAITRETPLFANKQFVAQEQLLAQAVAAFAHEQW